MIWNDEQLSILRKMAEAKASAATTANALGISRNAVLGKATRCGITFCSGKGGNTIKVRDTRMLDMRKKIPGKLGPICAGLR